MQQGEAWGLEEQRRREQSWAERVDREIVRLADKHDILATSSLTISRVPGLPPFLAPPSPRSPLPPLPAVRETGEPGAVGWAGMAGLVAAAGGMAGRAEAAEGAQSPALSPTAAPALASMSALR
jgi:hypothetical protein